MRRLVVSATFAVLGVLASSAAAVADGLPLNLTVSGTESSGGAPRPGAIFDARISDKLTLTISRTPVDHAVNRVTDYSGKYIYPGFTDDAFNNAHLTYALGTTLISAGYQQRVQQCCPSSHTLAAAPDSFHFWYVQADWLFGPNTRLGPRYALSLQDAEVPHATNPRFPNPNYAADSGHIIPSEGPKNKLTYVATITLPFDRAESVGGFITATNSWDYFLSSPIMYLYNEVNFGIVGRAGRGLTYNVQLQNVEQHHQPYPFANPNVINRHTLVTSLSYRLPL